MALKLKSDVFKNTFLKQILLKLVFGFPRLEEVSPLPVYCYSWILCHGCGSTRGILQTKSRQRILRAVSQVLQQVVCTYKVRRFRVE